MQKITPFLWFTDQAEEAAKFYTSVFSNSRINGISHYDENGPGPAGSVMVVDFQLDGQQFLALNGGPQFQFTEAVSFVINCKTQEEIDHYWNRLTEGGQEQMCGWLKDKFGLSWQVVPVQLGEFMQTSDRRRAGRVMQSMLQMKKMNIDALRRAYELVES